MNVRIKQYMLVAVLAVAAYFIMNNHIIIYGSNVQLLKKTSLHLHYTFYSITQKRPEVIMKIDYLREAGIGDLLVDLGVINAEEKSRLESKYSFE
jgi:hypothetical protein